MLYPPALISMSSLKPGRPGSDLNSQTPEFCAAQGELAPNSRDPLPPLLSSPLLHPSPPHLRSVLTGGDPHLYNQAPSTPPSPSPHTKSPLGHLSGLGVNTPAVWSTFWRMDPGKRPAQVWETDSQPVNSWVREFQGPGFWSVATALLHRPLCSVLMDISYNICANHQSSSQ